MGKQNRGEQEQGTGDKENHMKSVNNINIQPHRVKPGIGGGRAGLPLAQPVTIHE